MIEVVDPEKGLEVAVKVQFPNIANSIRSDLGYVKMLLTAGRLLPKGLFLDRTIEVRLTCLPSAFPSRRYHSQRTGNVCRTRRRMLLQTRGVLPSPIPLALIPRL